MPHKDDKLTGVLIPLKLNTFSLISEERCNNPHRVMNNETIGHDKHQEKFTSRMDGSLTDYVLWYIVAIESI